MSPNPEIEDFARRTRELLQSPTFARRVEGGRIAFASFTLEELDGVLRDDIGYYLLLAAAGLSRTGVKRAMADPEAGLVVAARRKAFAVQVHLPVSEDVEAAIQKSVALRTRDLQRKRRGAAEALLRERLLSEGIPICMSPPVRRVPGLLIAGRKPDGVYPDPATGRPPRLYLEIKNVRRVADDIQKRLYEIAEASLEMKLLYGDLALRGLNLGATLDEAGRGEHQGAIRAQVVRSLPVVVALLLCPRAEAERYRAGGETFIDRIFFQEELEDCIEFLRAAVAAGPG